MPATNSHKPRSLAGEFVSGLILPFRGAAFLLKNSGLKRYALLPLALNIILYIAVLAVLFWLISRWQIGSVEWDFWGPLGGWLAAAVNWLKSGLKVLAGLAAVMVAFFTFTAVGMVLASPLNDLLSEKVENVCRGSIKQLDLPWRFGIAAALTSAGDSLLNLVKQLVCTLPCLVFLFIPVLGFLPLFLVGSYFSGFGFLDSAMARNYLRPRHKRLLAKKRFWLLLGFGAAMQALFFIPLVGLLLMPLGVVSGTLVYCDADWRTLFKEANMPMPVGFIPPERVGDTDAPVRSSAGKDG